MTRAMQGPCEEIEQTCLFRWAALESGAHPELALLHAIPNGGRVSTEQIAWMDALARQGYKTALCHGWDAAREEIQRYLGGKWA